MDHTLDPSRKSYKRNLEQHVNTMSTNEMDHSRYMIQKEYVDVDDVDDDVDDDVLAPTPNFKVFANFKIWQSPAQGISVQLRVAFSAGG